MTAQSLTRRQLAYRVAILAAIGVVLFVVLRSIPYRWSFTSVFEARGQLLHGLWLTAILSLGAMALGLVLGTAGCLLRLAETDALRFLGTCYVELVRNTPLIVQLYIAYFCVFPALRYDDGPVIGALALGVFCGAYVTEILRAGVLSIDPGQTEAARSLGLSRAQTLAYVVFPQAIRRVIPPLAGQLVSLVKDSSLLSTISVAELTWQAETNAVRDYRFFEFYLVLAGLYLAITFPLSRLSIALERRLTPEARR